MPSYLTNGQNIVFVFNSAKDDFDSALMSTKDDFTEHKYVLCVHF